MKPARKLHHAHECAMLGPFGRFQAMVVGFKPSGTIEHARLERTDIAREPLPGRCRDQIEARSRTARTHIDHYHEPPQSALAILLRKASNLAVDRSRDLFGDKASGIQREIAKQRRREQNEDAEIDQRQFESGGAKEFAERRHVISSRSQRNRLPRTAAKYAAHSVGWRPRRGAAPRGESCPRSSSAIPRIQAGAPV